MVGIYNFTINLNQKLATPMGIYLEGEQYMNRDKAKIEIRTENGGDVIDFFDHPFFKGQYLLQCLDEKCCELSMKNEQIHLIMIFNGDIPYGRSRECQ